MGSIKCNESKAITYTTEEVEYTYDEIRDIFDDNKGCIPIQLLDRIEELELRLKLNDVGDNEALVIEVVELRAENQRLKEFVKKVMKVARDGDSELGGIEFHNDPNN